MARRRPVGWSNRRRARLGAYVVSQAGGVVRIVPRALSGPGLAGRIGAGVAAGVAAVLIGGWVGLGWFLFRPGAPEPLPPWWHVWLCPVTGFLPLASVLLFASARLWRARNTPLVIDPTGRVRYGRREITPSGSAKTVRLDRIVREVTDGDGYNVGTARMCLLYIEGTDGRFIALPDTYFTDFEGWELGAELARALAVALRVPISTGPVPTPHGRKPAEPGAAADGGGR